MKRNLAYIDEKEEKNYNSAIINKVKREIDSKMFDKYGNVISDPDYFDPFTDNEYDNEY